MHVNSMSDSPKNRNWSPDDVNVEEDRIQTISYPEVVELQRISTSSTNDVHVTD